MQREKGTCIICGSAATQLRPFLQIHNPTSTATDAQVSLLNEGATHILQPYNPLSAIIPLLILQEALLYVYFTLWIRVAEGRSVGVCGTIYYYLGFGPSSTLSLFSRQGRALHWLVATLIQDM